MSKKSNRYVCSQCGYESLGYLGKCPVCLSWGTLEEAAKRQDASFSERPSSLRRRDASAKPLREIPAENSARVFSGLQEFDRVMGGGIVRDSVTILTARPGAGKSTLLLQLLNTLGLQRHRVLYASGEESESQIRKRAERILPEISEHLYVLGTTSLDEVMEQAESISVDAIVIDSIQTFVLEEHLPARAGSPTQTLECAYRCVEYAKRPDRPTMVFLIGQMNKEDELKGLRAIEHLVDTVLYIEGEKGESLRTLVATKNRYGSTGETGFFRMEAEGLVSIENPSEFFMTERNGQGVRGSALGVIKEGTRPIVLEVESLMNRSFTPYPSRMTDSIRKDTLNIMISILEDSLQLNFYDKNVVLKAAGGLKTSDPSFHLAVVMSIASSYYGKPIPPDVVFIGDVALTGEIRKTRGLEDRIREAKRLGFREIVVSSNFPSSKSEERVVPIRHVRDAVRRYFGV